VSFFERSDSPCLKMMSASLSFSLQVTLELNPSMHTMKLRDVIMEKINRRDWVAYGNTMIFGMYVVANLCLQYELFKRK
jgi:hypothetical protein